MRAANLMASQAKVLLAKGHAQAGRQDDVRRRPRGITILEILKLISVLTGDERM
jgi:hypothetical protein